jgi:uncharacterized protein YdaU (DUF1376 family)
MKDPAFLFYTNDFDSGTKFLTNEQLGIYVRVLMAQHQHGRLTEKQILFIMGKMDEDVILKFKKDDKGLYFNERLENEIERRKSFSNSRRENVKKRYNSTSVDTSVSTSVDTSVLRMETENETINNTINVKNGFFANSENMGLELSEINIDACIQYLHLTKQKKVNKEFICKLWQIFKLKEFTGLKFYNSEADIFCHFLNSLKYEKIEDVKQTIKHNDTKAKNILSMTD